MMEEVVETQKIVRCLLLKNDTVLVSEIFEVGSELGEPDCLLVNPYKLVSDEYLEPWLNFTNDTQAKIHSDSILTMVNPKPEILSNYISLTEG